MTFGEKLQELRRKQAMSQDALAERLEVSRQAVSKWERDEAMPETDKIVRIAQLFGVSTDYLLLDEQKQETRQQSQPQYTGQPQTARWNSHGQRIERFIRRHGYKSGYVLIGIGVFLCILALLVYTLLPQFGKNFFDPVKDFAGSMGGGFWGDGITEQLPDTQIRVEGDLDQEILDLIPGILEEEEQGYISNMGGMLDGGFDTAVDSMQQTWTNSLKIMAAMWATPILLAGIGLIVLGAFIVKKGKALAKTGPEL